VRLVFTSASKTGVGPEVGHALVTLGRAVTYGTFAVLPLQLCLEAAVRL